LRGAPLTSLSKKRRKPQIDRMIPLINVVFLLLAFFILAGTFRMFDLSGVQLPSSSLMGSSKTDGTRIGMLGDGRIRWQGELYSVSEFDQVLRGIAGSQVFLYADGTLKMNEIRPIWRKLKEAGKEDIHLIVLKGGAE